MVNAFSNKSILVAGAGSGIGRASAEGFAAASARVTVVDVDPAGGEATVTAITERGRVARFVQADVSDEASVEAAVTKRNGAHGEVRTRGARVSPRPAPDETFRDRARGRGGSVVALFRCGQFHHQDAAAGRQRSPSEHLSTREKMPRPIELERR